MSEEMQFTLDHYVPMQTPTINYKVGISKNYVHGQTLKHIQLMQPSLL